MIFVVSYLHNYCLCNLLMCIIYMHAYKNNQAKVPHYQQFLYIDVLTFNLAPTCFNLSSNEKYALWKIINREIKSVLDVIL